MKPSLGVVMVYIGNVDITLDAIETLVYTSRNCFNVNLFLFKNGPSKDGLCIDEDYLMSLEHDGFKIHHIKFPINVGIIRPRNIGCEMVVQAGCNYCLICDDDVLFGDGWPVMCLEAMLSHEVMGHILCKINFKEGHDWFQYYEMYGMRYLNSIYDTACVSTCFMFMKREVLLAGAQFDPYWIHRCGFDDIQCHGGANEDIDFCLQARQYGFKIASGHVPYLHIASSGRNLWGNKEREGEIYQRMVQKIFYRRWKDLEFKK